MSAANPAITLTPGQATELTTALAPAATATAARSIPRKGFRAHAAALDANPANGPRYRNRTDEGSVRFMFSTGQVFVGTLMVMYEVILASPEAKLIDLAKNAHAEFTASGRLEVNDGTHDLAEFARGYVGDVSTWVSGARQTRSDRDESRRRGRKAPVYSAHALYGPPAGQVRHLARGVIRSWLPAIQNIISRLPPSERQAEKARAEVQLSEYVNALAKMATLARKASDEYKRWERAFGAVDLAILASAEMVTFARKLADRMEGDDSTTQQLLRAASEADKSVTAALDKLSIARFDSMYERAWYHNKADMLAFARANGGIGADLEVLYHTKGSKFRGY